jgi:hypothetical protein
MKLTYEALLNDPGLLDRILADARRERARAVYELVVAPVAALVARPFKTDSHHAARPHLARQG